VKKTRKNTYTFVGKHICRVESVQKRFTRYICMRCNIPFVSYHDRLYKLNIRSLEYRRTEFDMIYMYKICHGLTDVCFSDFFEYCTSKYDLRRHRLHFKSLVRAKLDCHHYFFTQSHSEYMD